MTLVLTACVSLLKHPLTASVGIKMQPHSTELLRSAQGVVINFHCYKTFQTELIQIKATMLCSTTVTGEEEAPKLTAVLLYQMSMCKRCPSKTLASLMGHFRCILFWCSPVYEEPIKCFLSI